MKKATTKKRETQEQMIERLLKKHVIETNTRIEGCNFTAVKFNEAATEAVTLIAEGLVENAKALGQLSYVLKASNVNIETMIKLDNK